jgi:RNA polymerase sigma factor (sigma-70 family)
LVVTDDREINDMDVQRRAPGQGGSRGASEGLKAVAAARATDGALRAERVGEALGEWQAGELRIARSFAECRGLGHEQLEDLYQETALVLLGRPYHSEEHLRNALRWGMKHRALHLHRDERRRGEILARHAPELHLAAQRGEDDSGPEPAAISREDRLVVSEFMTELTALEQRVFWLMAEGIRYRAIAPMLGVTVNEARKASRACERKREGFQLLYDTGRLCGFRSRTIRALQRGQGTSEELARRAFAHLEGCSRCRAEHRTNARRLRRSFQGQLAGLLPMPVFAGHIGWLSRIDFRVRSLQHRLLPDGTPIGTGDVRERAVAMLAGTGIAAKVTAGVATVAVVAGGTIGASRVLNQPHASHHGHRAHAVARSSLVVPAQPPPPMPEPADTHPAQSGAEAQSHPTPSGEPPRAGARREPGGFAYLGVPAGATAPAYAAETTHAAAAHTGGGAFSP